MFTTIFQNVKIVMLQRNILQYLTKILRQYFNCNEILEIFLLYFTWVKFSTWELVSVITGYELEFITQKFQIRDPIWPTKIIKKIYMDKIQYTEVFAVADAKTRNAKIPQNFGLVKLQNFYGNYVTSFYSTYFILKLLIKIFQWFAVAIGRTRVWLECKNNSHVFRS